MQSENKTCQNCKKDFIIEPDDFGFYEKMKVPPPTFCPECRLKRRMSWRNDWHLFKKKDALTGDMIFSLFPEESPVKVYDRDYWWSDGWDPLEYGRDYDFSKSFFEQFKELLYAVPLPSQSMTNVVNCKYCANASNVKNCYFSMGIAYTEDCAYVIWDQESKECLDSHITNRCELGYRNVNTIVCYKTFFSVDCESCQEMILCKDCVGCNSCIASIGLRNKSYCIFNEQYSKEEYVKKLQELNLDSHKALEELKVGAYKHWLKFPQKYIHGHQNMNVSGDYIYESKNAKNGEFFPSSLSFFPYKITQAYEFFPLDEKEAKAKGFVWYETTKQNYKITLKNQNIPDSIKNVDENVLNEVIECVHVGSCEHECTGVFRIIERELEFLKRMGLPLPRLCPNCRHYGRLVLRNPPELSRRTCMCEKENHLHGTKKCEVKFETSYAPDRPEIVYCEKCYQQEVY